ncbi:helix-turn-helix domain-containing protein [Bacillus taeanensis]|uniref:XRE family transcriptional regulator n=1 Tax=Bacillus taeanensis TaxID=273032 RepID=A0A366XTJ6_9BACI|nr:helix-turn-helix transcriptional regulator [Bacillus taeanensis]RBW67281.1 XRE family transcriptional regulator [Bacillus taeanensis]
MSDIFKKYGDIVGDQHVKKLQHQGYIAAQIKKKRRDLNMSQQELADLIKKPKSTIGRIEAGLTIPRVDTLYDISKALGIPIVIDGTNPDSKNTYVEV